MLSVHNAGYQGHFAPEILPELSPEWDLFTPRHLEWYPRVDLLKGGLVFADAVTRVSRTHAEELRTTAGGFGLDGVCAALRERLVGIANGIDQAAGEARHDPPIPCAYSADDPSGKRRCRVALQRAFGLRCACRPRSSR